jgi:hypothetical protein
VQYPTLFTPESLTFETYFWIVCLVKTRSFGKYSTGHYVVPLADLLNHDPRSLTSYMIGSPDLKMHSYPLADDYDYEPDEATHPRPPALQALAKLHYTEENNELQELIAGLAGPKEDNGKEYIEWEYEKIEPAETMELKMLTGETEWYPAGSQLTLYYGAYANQTLLLEYGFVLENTPYCYVNVLVSPFSFPLSEALIERVTALDLNRKVYFKVAIRHICEGLLAFGRTLLWDKATNAPISFLLPQNIGLEIRTVEACIGVARELLAAYPTTLEEDEKAEIQGIRHYFAVTYRKGLKRCLLAQIQYLQDLLAVLKAVQTGASIEEALERLELQTDSSILKEYLDKYGKVS